MTVRLITHIAATSLFALWLNDATAIAQIGGYQSNGAGGYYGTGNNMGSGWQSNGAGGYYGTGNNMGKTCTSNGMNGINCY